MCDGDKACKACSGKKKSSRGAPARARRDPMRLADLVVGGLYHLEWDAHDEGGVGMYRYLGMYQPTWAYMFQPVKRLRRSGAEIPGDTIYLFPHEIEYLQALTPLADARGERMQRNAPQSERRPRMTVPMLRPGRVLTRPLRSSPNMWDVGIVGAPYARAARFVGFRRIDGELFAVWVESTTLYAQPWSSP